MEKKRFHVLCWILSQFYLLCCVSGIVHARYPSTKKYPTTQACILDNFQCLLELGTGIPVFKLAEIEGNTAFYFPFNGGIVIGYYLSKYHYKPTPEDLLKEKRNFVYNSSKNRYEEMHNIDPGTPREGEASVVLQVGLKYPFQERAEPAAFDHFRIIEKFLSVPISIKWTVPITLWKQDIFHITAFGLNVKYLMSSTYIPDLGATDLPVGVPRTTLDLKQYVKGISSFSCSAFFEYGFLLPIGLSINLIVSCPLEFTRYRSVKPNFPSEKGYINKDYIWITRCFYLDNMVAINIGLDCFYVFKKSKGYKKHSI